MPQAPKVHFHPRFYFVRYYESAIWNGWRTYLNDVPSHERSAGLLNNKFSGEPRLSERGVLTIPQSMQRFHAAIRVPRYTTINQHFFSIQRRRPTHLVNEVHITDTALRQHFIWRHPQARKYPTTKKTFVVSALSSPNRCREHDRTSKNVYGSFTVDFDSGASDKKCNANNKDQPRSGLRERVDGDV